MHCPDCGEATVAGQQFCRACGSGLATEVGRRIPRMFWGLTVMFGGILVALVGMMIETRFVTLIGFYINTRDVRHRRVGYDGWNGPKAQKPSANDNYLVASQSRNHKQVNADDRRRPFPGRHRTNY